MITLYLPTKFAACLPLWRYCRWLYPKKIKIRKNYRFLVLSMCKGTMVVSKYRKFETAKRMPKSLVDGGLMHIIDLYDGSVVKAQEKNGVTTYSRLKQNIKNNITKKQNNGKANLL